MSIFRIMEIFQKYDVTSEFMMLGVAIVMLVITVITRPKHSLNMHLTKAGLVMSIITIFNHISLLWVTHSPEVFSRGKFLAAYYVYSVSYILILHNIMVYFDTLSYKKRTTPRKTFAKIILFTILYLTLMSYPVITDKIYVINSDGSITLTSWQYILEICGIICAFSCLVYAIKNFKSIARVAGVGMILFAPLEILILLFQFYFKTVYFVSFTYVLPFTIFYCLFHGNKFDDIIGCQNAEALVSVIARAIRSKKNFVTIRVEFPQLKSREYSDVLDIIQYVSSDKCRKIERLKFTSRIYVSGAYKYTLFSYVKDENDALDLAKKIYDIVDEPIILRGAPRKAPFKLSVIYCNPLLENSSQYNAMFSFLQHYFKDDNETEYIAAVQKDYEAFKQYSEAEKLVLDVRNSNNPDDERVVCYIQPIHSISRNSFRTGEALMRMQSNGKMFFPDTFIPAAERNNCIHTLTLIMINRICHKIKELENSGYDFDGITVNCSTLELANQEFHQEIKDIVRKTGIIPSHLKLEITETTTDINFTNVLTNMQKLIEYGILFYLDDYGTGYSNIERMANYPFSTIKFDKSILYSALANSKADSLIRMQLNYFRANGFKTVVEGVEDESQYNYCREVGFDMIQGYYFSKPQPADKITNFFEK